MAAKGKKAPLREDIESQEAWDAYLEKEGVKIVDAFTEWCGPCKAVLSLFRRLKTDLGDNLLNFATVNTDKVGSLKAYNGHSEPTFLFYAKNVLVNVVRGADGPLLERTIKSELANEHTVLDTGAPRKSHAQIAIPEPVLLDNAPQASAEAKKSSGSDGGAGAGAGGAGAGAASGEQLAGRTSSSRAKRREYTLAMIKPDALEHADEIFAKIAESHLHVQTQTEVTMSLDQTCAFYQEHRGKSFFQALTEFMSTGSVIPIVLAGHNPVAEWRQLAGPTSSEKAKADNPTTVRALFGTDSMHNAVHTADSVASAHREILFFFPEWAQENLAPETSVIALRGNMLQHAEAIKASLLENGYKILRERTGELSTARAQTLVAKVSFGTAEEWENPMHVFQVEKIAAIRGVVDLIGPLNHERAATHFPESFSAKYCTSGQPHELYFPSNAEQSAEAASVFFDPDETAIIEPPGIVEPTAADTTTATAPETTTAPATTTSEPTPAIAEPTPSSTDTAAHEQPSSSPPKRASSASHKGPSLHTKNELDFEAEAQKLRNDSGLDKEGIVAVLGSVPRSQRLKIVDAYNAKFSRNFVEDAKVDLKGDMEELVISSVLPEDDFFASYIHHTLKVLESNIHELAEVAISIPAASLVAARTAYTRLFEGDIEKAIDTHAPAGLAAALLKSVVMRSADGWADAATLEAAGKSLADNTATFGSETSPLIAAFAAAGGVGLAALAAEFHKVSGITLKDAVHKEVPSGPAQTVIITMIDAAIDLHHHFGKAIVSTMEGPGTRDHRLQRLVLWRAEVDMEAIKAAVVEKNSKTLETFIKHDTSGAYESMLLRLINC